MTETTQNRLHGLDFCRAVFMVMGLFFHAGLIYGVGEWRVTFDDPSPYIDQICKFIHYFRMEAFYLISGFFFMLVFSKGKPGFLLNRISRALVPMLFCGLFINPFMNFFSYRGNYGFSPSYIFYGKWMAHLWFLGNLIVYFLLTAPLCHRITHSKLMGKKTLFVSFYLLVPLVAAVAAALSQQFINKIILFISFNNLLYYYCYFVFGCYLYRNKELFLSFLTLKTSVFSIGLFILIFQFSNTLLLSSPDVRGFFMHIGAGSLVLGMISIVYLVGARGSKVVRSLSDASYTIYLLHQPLIILLYVFVFEHFNTGAFLGYSVMVISVLFISYFFHVFVVKKSKVIRFLFNGVTFKVTGAAGGTLQRGARLAD